MKYGWQAFKNAGDAQTIALGQTHTAAYNGTVSILQNPAHTHQFYDRVLYTHQSRFAGLVNSDLLAIPTINRFRLPVNLIIFYEGIGNIPDTRDILLDWGNDGIPGTSDPGENNGLLDEGERLDADQVAYFSQSQMGLHLSTSLLWKNWVLGIGMKGFFHSLADHYSTGIGLDIGLKKPLWKGSTFGIVLTDATSSILVWENGTVELFSPEFYTGLSQVIEIPKLPIKFNVMFDLAIDPFAKHLSDDFNLGNFGGRYRGGIEINYDQIAVRFGRNINAIKTAGVGIDWGESALHYAFTLAPSSSNLGDTHLISFSVKPQWLQNQIGKLF